MAAQASTDDDFITLDDPLLDGHTELADGIAVAPCTVEMIDPTVDGVADQGARFFIGDGAELVSEALRAERNDRDRQSCFSPRAVRNLLLTHDQCSFRNGSVFRWLQAWGPSKKSLSSD